MSGISFKISAPSRPSTASAPPTRPSSGAGHRRPAPASARDGDSSDEDGERARGAQGGGYGSRKRARLDRDGEEVVEFGAEGAKSKHAKAAPAGPLVIPALPNKDWRQAAEQMRAGRPGRTKKQLYLPETGGGMSMTSRVEGAPPPTPSAAAELADQINAAPVVGGLEQPVRRARDGEGEGAAASAEAAPQLPPPPPVEARAPMTDEQRALRELLGSAEGGAGEQEQELAAIYSGPDARTGPTDEGDAFKQDVSSRPDQSTLDDYARVPVGQFGLAMLRGMGWQPGQPASRSGRAGPTEAYVPAARPHMLGIGAKPMAEAMGSGGAGTAGASGGKGGKKDAPRRMGRDEMRFVPLVKQARASGGESASGSGRSTPLPLPSTDRNGSHPSSRRTSRSPPPTASSSSRRDRDRDYDRDRGSSRRDRDDDRSSSRRDRDRDEGRSSRRERERERDEPRDGHRERERERGSSTRDREYERRDERRERDRGERRDRERR
ncbi:hypothetical protein JCM8208_007410 [Rhodotorula glutinis]